MARYHQQIQSATAPAANALLGGLACIAAQGFNFRRITGGLVTVGSTAAPPDQDCQLGIAVISAVGTGAVTAPSPSSANSSMNQNTNTPQCIPFVSYATTPPTFNATGADPFVIPVSSRGGFDLYWESVEEWQILKGASNGLAFVNRGNALTSPLAWQFMWEWEE
jgi:hypothetical protein